jgi:hypothetical protein
MFIEGTKIKIENNEVVEDGRFQLLKFEREGQLKRPTNF